MRTAFLASHRRPLTRSIRLWALTALTLLLCGPAQALPRGFTASYDVQLAGFTLGKADLQLTRHGEDYRYSSFIRSTGLFSFIYDLRIHEFSTGRITDQGIKPERYEYHRRGKKSRDGTLTFDWQAKRITNDIRGKVWHMDIPGDTVDRMASQLALMQDLSEGKKNLTYNIADGGKLKQFNLREVGRETVDTPVGKFATVKVVREAEDHENRTTFWCAPDLQYLPVKVEHWDKDDGTFRMALVGLKGMGKDLKGSMESNYKLPRGMGG